MTTRLERPARAAQNQATLDKPATTAVAFDAEAACAECGVFGAFAFGTITICGKCYEEKGSCCPEFGKDDLWQSCNRL